MANTFKKGIDRQMWVLTPQTPNAHAAGGSLASDYRNDYSRDPFIRQMVSATVINRYNIFTKSWSLATNPSLAGTFGAGATTVFAPSRAFQGTITAGATTTVIPTSTVLAAAPGLNNYANRGGTGEYGFKIRIIGNTAGKTEERYIVANSSTTTPTFVLDSALSFTPSSGDLYEVISGRYFMLNAGTLAAGILKSFETANNTLTSLGTTNLPNIGTDSSFVALDEQYVPYSNSPGDGFIQGTYVYSTGATTLYALAATGAGASSLTGQSANGDAIVAVNEFRNFQIRIVEDTTTPTSVGQRRVIASHTAGPSPVYTLGSAWTVTPSATCKFVIEYPNLILLRTGTNTATYTYNYGTATINNGTNTIAADAWSTTYFAGGNANAAGGLWMPSFSIIPDTPQRYSRNSFIYFWRGGGVATLDLFDIANTITGTWTSNISYDGSGSALPNTGTCGSNGPVQNEGRFFYLNVFVNNAINQIYRFDLQNRVLSPYTPTEYLQTGTAVVGNRFACYVTIDGSDKYNMLFILNHLQTITEELVVQV